MIQINNKKTPKTREQHIEDVLTDLEKNLSNFQLSLQTKDKTIKEYVRLINFTKTKYQKFFNRNRQLKEKIILLEKEKSNLNNKKEQIIKKNNIKKNQTSNVNQKQRRKK